MSDYTIHCTLYTIYYTTLQYTTHYTTVHYTMHYTVYTIQCTQYTTLYYTNSVHKEYKHHTSFFLLNSTTLIMSNSNPAVSK